MDYSIWICPILILFIFILYEGGNPNLNNNQQQPNKYYDDMNMDMDERFYDDESLTQEVVVMKTLNRKEILKQYYSSGTSDTERHSSSSDPYDCIVVQDHQVMRNKNNIFNNNSTNNRKNNKNKEMTTFRGEFATTTNKNNNSKSMMDQEHTATILPRTKLVKSSADQSMEKVGTGKKSRDANKPSDHHQSQKKKPQNVGPASNDKRKNFEESKRNSLSSAKSYGPWYDLWGANPNNSPNNHNNTLISQKWARERDRARIKWKQIHKFKCQKQGIKMYMGLLYLLRYSFKFPSPITSVVYNDDEDDHCAFIILIIIFIVRLRYPYIRP